MIRIVRRQGTLQFARNPHFSRRAIVEIDLRTVLGRGNKGIPVKRLHWFAQTLGIAKLPAIRHTYHTNRSPHFKRRTRHDSKVYSNDHQKVRHDGIWDRRELCKGGTVWPSEGLDGEKYGVSKRFKRQVGSSNGCPNGEKAVARESVEVALFWILLTSA